MPVYEYEPKGFDCLICPGRFETIQAVNDAPLLFCPTCGLDVVRVVSRACIRLEGRSPETRAEKGGFTKFRKAESGTWERIEGAEGPETFHREREELPPTPKVLDLDAE